MTPSETNSQPSCIEGQLFSMPASIGFDTHLSRVWDEGHGQEYEIIRDIRSAVAVYSQQTAYHFASYLKVFQLRTCEYDTPCKQYRPQRGIDVLLSSSSTEAVYVRCRRHETTAKPTSEKSWKSLDELLSDLPLNTQYILSSSEMLDWWQKSKKRFNWNRLPTEITTEILAFCFSCQQPPVRRRRSEAHILWPLEIKNFMGNSCSLLHVSRAFRDIALRLCLYGSKSHGIQALHVNARSCEELATAVTRLSMLQVQVPSSSDVAGIPNYFENFHRYFWYPKLYPSLSAYATSRHAIQTVDLAMDFLNFFKFFCISPLIRLNRRKTKTISYKFLERLPALRRISITLPSLLEERAMTYQRHILFHSQRPCYTTLYRRLYEEASWVLASYEDIEWHGFHDESEKMRCVGAQDAARAQWLSRDGSLMTKFTKVELDDLYGGNEGGVLLEEEFRQPEADFPEASQFIENRGLHMAWPPRCDCQRPCTPDLWY